MSKVFQSSVHKADIADLVQRLPKREEETFWRDQLRGFTSPALGAVRPPDAKDKTCARHAMTIPAGLKESLEILARKFELSRDTIYIAAWAHLLSRYSTEERVLFSARFVSLQSNPERLWPILLTVKQNETVANWLKDIQVIRDDLKKREPVSEADLRLWCEVPAEQTLIETILDFTDSSAIGNPTLPLELRFSADTGSIVLAYWAKTFSADSVRRLAEQYVCLLQEIGEKPGKKVAELNMLPASQRQQIVVDWNSTQKKYPQWSGLQQLFENKAAEIPEEIAVEFPRKDAGSLLEHKLSYRDLNIRANQLARHLQKLGVGSDIIVGISAERSIEMVIGALAVVKAGGAYAPLDPTYPEERVRFMIEDTRAPVILTQEKLAANFSTIKTHVFCLDTDWKKISGESGDNLPCTVTPDNLAYLIYTSGSTGKPKGVAMRQGPLINLLSWQIENWSSSPKARTLQFASLNFDVSFQELFSTWCSGGTLVLITDADRRDARVLARYIAENQVQRLFLPFVALKHLAEACEREKIYPASLREVITAGEQLQVTPQVFDFFSHLPQCTLENQYGPSETHVVTAFRLAGAPAQWPGLPSIGKPIANTRIYLLDDHLQPVAIGVPGELYLGGVCLARGYLNRPDLTAEKFITDPFDTELRVYKTGDLARWMPDGNIEFLGRIDHQVKVRGFRIELGEIETVLSKHPGIREAVVIARDSDLGDKQLVAYLVSKNGAVSSGELRSYLQQHLPPYCVPAAFMFLPTLPLTPNGKVDRRALPKPTIVEEPLTDIDLPRTPLEMQLKLVFEQFFHRRPIGTKMSFFELGGDSLLALKLVVEIERATGKKLELNILFQAPTIQSLAEALQKNSNGAEFSSLVPLQPLGTRPPLFLIHTTPGDVLGYGNLVYHLDRNLPCYGFQSLGFDSPELSHGSIEEMAAYYVKLLRKQQPHGPYYLGGWCYGGVIAVEMAQQLHAAGEKIAPLLLIETPAPAPSWKHYYYYVRRVGCLLSMTPRQWRGYLSAKYHYYKGRKMADEMRFHRVDAAPDVIDPALEEQNRQLAKLERVYAANMHAWQKYKPVPYSGRVVLFNAAEQDPAIVHDPAYGWPGLARKIETHVIPGNHDTILMEPHVSVLAEKINTCLLQAQQFLK